MCLGCLKDNYFGLEELFKVFWFLSSILSFAPATFTATSESFYNHPKERKNKSIEQIILGHVCFHKNYFQSKLNLH